MAKEKGISSSPEERLLPTIKGKNFFFGIGINTYPEDFSPLLNARKDVEDIHSLLLNNYYFDEENTMLLLDDEANRANIIDELTIFRRKIKEEDRLLLYYSGHGYLDKESELGYWIPSDAKRDRYSSYLSNSEVLSILKTTKAKHILLISDSCFSASLLFRDKSKDIGEAFKDWEQNPSRYVFISGKGIVLDGKKGENSPFASGILKHLRQNNENAINIAKLADSVTKEVRFEYEQQAEAAPLYQSGHKGGQFIFWKRQTERNDWQTAQQINSEAAYLLFLEKHPKGEHASEADEALLHLADKKEWHKAMEKDAAFAYRAYLRIYPNGQFVAMANAKIEAIKKEEQIEQERNEKAEREQQAKWQEEKRIALLEQQVKAERQHKRREKFEQYIIKKKKEAQEKAVQEKIAQEKIEQELFLKEKIEHENLSSLEQKHKISVLSAMQDSFDNLLKIKPDDIVIIMIKILLGFGVILLIWLMFRKPNLTESLQTITTTDTTKQTAQNQTPNEPKVTQPYNDLSQNGTEVDINKKTEKGFKPSNSLPKSIEKPNVEVQRKNGEKKKISLDSIVIYERFTPNNDGINDIFFIKNIEYFPNNNLTIFNRWGQIVFQTLNYKNNWNGTFNGGKLPDDVYYYRLIIEKKEWTGVVNLLR